MQVRTIASMGHRISGTFVKWFPQLEMPHLGHTITIFSIAMKIMYGTYLNHDIQLMHNNSSNEIITCQN